MKDCGYAREGSLCAVFTCKNYSTQKNSRSMFRFPTDKELCQKWLIASRRQDLDKVFKLHGPEKLHKSHRICADHFEQKAFRNPKLHSQGLVKGSIPTVNLGVPTTPHRQSPKKRVRIPSPVPVVEEQGEPTQKATKSLLGQEYSPCTLQSPVTNPASQEPITSPVSHQPVSTASQGGPGGPVKWEQASPMLPHLPATALQQPVSSPASQQHASHPGLLGQGAWALSGPLPDVRGAGRSPQQLEEEIKRLRSKLRNSQKHVSKLRIALRRAKSEKSLLSAELAKKSEATAKSQDAGSGFLLSQLKVDERKCHGRRYSEQDKTFALALHRHSPKAYLFMCERFCLPNVKSLRSWLGKRNVSHALSDHRYSVNKSSSKPRLSSPVPSPNTGE